MESELLADCQKTVGLKQTIRAVEKGIAKQVFIAEDANPNLLSDLISRCEAASIPIIKVATMEELGRACQIQVGSATAASLKNTD